LRGLCFLLPIAAYLRYVRAESRGWYWLTIGAFTAALAVKSMVVTLPCVLLLLDAWPLGRLRSARDLPGLVWEKTPFFLLAAVFCAVTVFAQADMGVAKSLQRHGLADRVETTL